MKEDKKQTGFWMVIILLLIVAVAEGVMLIQRDHGPMQPTRQTGFWDNNRDGYFLHPGVVSDRGPFAELNRIREHIDRIFGESLSRLHGGMDNTLDVVFSPRIDLEETSDGYTVTADLPGMDKADIEVSIHGQVLTLSGTRNEESNKTDAEGNVLQMERESGRFQRLITFPTPVDASKMEAVYRNGELKITVPRIASSNTGRKVPVR
jgi:HSP20 family protein